MASYHTDRTCICLSILGALAVILAYAPAISSHPQEAVVRRSMALIENSRHAEAEALLHTFVQKRRDHAQAWGLLGLLKLRRANPREAHTCFSRALETEPGNSMAPLGLGVTLVYLGQPAKAEKELAKVLESPRFGFEAKTQWIWSLFVQGHEQAALQEALAAAKQYPSVADFHQLVGLLYHARGQHSKAADAYRRTLKFDPTRLNVYFRLLSIAKAQQDWKSARNWTEAALSLDIDHPVLHREIAFVQRKLGNEEKAREAEQQATRTFEAEMLYLKATKSTMQGATDQAETWLRQCLRENPRLSKAWTDLGELLRQTARFAEAENSFILALETDPENSLAYCGLAATLRTQGKQDEAIRVYRKALERGLKKPDLFSGLASLYLEQGKLQEAAVEMADAVGRFPDDADLLSYFGHLQRAQGKSLEAGETLAKALFLNPYEIDSLWEDGNLHLSRAAYRKAVHRFQSAVRIDPRHAASWHGLIRAYSKSGETKQAEEMCRRCLNELPRDLECRQQLASLRMEASDYLESKRLFQNLLRSGVASKEILDGLAFSRLYLKEYAGAAELLESSLDRFGADSWVHTNLGYAYRSLGHWSEALDHYRRASDLGGDPAQQSYDLAYTLFLSGDYRAALEPFRRAVKARPAWGLAHHNLAMNYWNLGQHSMAMIHARLSVRSGFEQAGSIIRNLEPYLSPDFRASMRAPSQEK